MKTKIKYNAIMALIIASLALGVRILSYEVKLDNVTIPIRMVFK